MKNAHIKIYSIFNGKGRGQRAEGRGKGRPREGERREGREGSLVLNQIM
jgi:hypothetical protein